MATVRPEAIRHPPNTRLAQRLEMRNLLWRIGFSSSRYVQIARPKDRSNHQRDSVTVNTPLGLCCATMVRTGQCHRYSE